MPERILPNGHHQMRHQVKHHISGLRVHGEEKQRQLHQRIDKNQIDMSREWLHGQSAVHIIGF